MEITLRIDGKEKTFINDFVKGRIFRNALKLNSEIKNGAEYSEEYFDKLVEFVVGAFDNQFTIDEFWDGVKASEVQFEITRVFHEVLNIGGLEVQAEGNGMGE